MELLLTFEIQIQNENQCEIRNSNPKFKSEIQIWNPEFIGPIRNSNLKSDAKFNVNFAKSLWTSQVPQIRNPQISSPNFWSPQEHSDSIRRLGTQQSYDSAEFLDCTWISFEYLTNFPLCSLKSMPIIWFCIDTCDFTRCWAAQDLQTLSSSLSSLQRPHLLHISISVLRNLPEPIFLPIGPYAPEVREDLQKLCGHGLIRYLSKSRHHDQSSIPFQIQQVFNDKSYIERAHMIH